MYSDKRDFLFANDGVKVLSLFDGMACGMLALIEQNIKVSRYVAYEIDKYAIKATQHNFPMIEEKGDVFAADFTQYQGFDYLVGGSPCTYWSIAQKNNRETEASGLGWELFSQYVRALNEAKPKYFIYENNKSMSKAIRDSIRETFGFEEICINSALVSAQNRQRYYWVGKRNPDGTYSKVEIEQPEDRGIILKDILETGYTWKDKQNTIDANYFKGGNVTTPGKQSGQRNAVAEPVGITENGKAFCLTVSYKNAVLWNTIERSQRSMVAEPVGTTEKGKAFCLTGNYDGAYPEHTLRKSVRSMRAEPVCMRYERSDEAKKVRKDYESGATKHGFHELSELHPRPDGKTNTLSTVGKDNPICEPVKVGCIPSPDGSIKNAQANRVYSAEGKSVNLVANAGGAGGKTGLYAVPIKNKPIRVGGFGKQAQGERIYSSKGGACICDPSNHAIYAIPVEFENNIPTKAISLADGKTHQVYKVEAGQITIKGKQYPIKLVDGYYIIRKLTVRECMRLQTVPEWYDFSCVSDTQAYKMLGNGWTVSVIAFLLKHTK